MFGRGPRQRRGNVRSAILTVLAEQPRNGYGIMQELESKSGGQWRPSSGSVYPTLQQLEDEGLVEIEAQAAGTRVYKLTPAGKKYVEKNKEQLEVDTAPTADTHGARWEMMMIYRQLGSAFMQVVQSGAPEQIAEAKRLVEETRRKLYGILAQDPHDDAADDDDDDE